LYREIATKSLRIKDHNNVRTPVAPLPGSSYVPNQHPRRHYADTRFPYQIMHTTLYHRTCIPTLTQAYEAS
jgi:hypothetical protein